MFITLLRWRPNFLSAQYLRFLFPVGLVLFTGFYLADYLHTSATTLLVGAAAIISTVTVGRVKRPHRFAVATLVLLALTWLVPVNTLLYFSVACALFYWAEAQGFGLQPLSLVALFLSSPAFQYTAHVFSFPIRLQLAKIAGSIFHLFSSNVQIKGNTIFYDGHEFAVDQACAGLNMLTLSMLLGILLLGLLQKKAGKTIGLKTAAIYLLALFCLNLFANVLRIVLLVQFAVPPEAVMHEVVGLLCLLLYVCLPAGYLALFFVKRAATTQPSTVAVNKAKPVVQVLLMVGLLLLGQRVITADTYAKFQKNYTAPVVGYTSSVFRPGIVKLENAETLVYVKFIRGFYDTEHNPTLCWKGSGYEFTNVKKQSVGGREIYTAALIRAEEKLHTAWWYGNATEATTSQWEWRKNMLKSGDSYALINVTAATERVLLKKMKQLLLAPTLAPLFKQE